jgi:hypothetical protein
VRDGEGDGMEEVNGRGIDEQKIEENGWIKVLALITGIAVMTIPFTGSWWILKFAEVLIFEFSPFDMRLEFLGESVEIPAIQYALLSFKILIVISGIFIVIGALTNKWWSRHLLRFGAGKPAWFVLGILITVVLFIPLNSYLQNMDIPFQLPIYGEKTVSFQQENIRVSFKIVSKFTESFIYALIVSILGLYVRFKIKPLPPKKV